MYTKLSSIELASGQTVIIARIEGPERAWRDRLLPFLSHKGEPWVSQIRQTLETSTAPLVSRYYVGTVDDRVVGNVCTFTYRGVGLFGHVFTDPDYRRQGISKAIIKEQMADFASEGKALFLGTGLDGHARRMYKSFGYESLTEQSYEMALYSNSELEFNTQFFRPGASETRQMDWRDWALLSALMMQPEGSDLRLVAFSVIGRATMEATYLEMRQRRNSKFAVLQGAEGAAVGLVALVPDRRFPGVQLLDLFVHPNYRTDGLKLVSEVDLESIDKKIQSYALPTDDEKIGVLEASGFSVEARLESQIALPGRISEDRSSLLILSR